MNKLILPVLALSLSSCVSVPESVVYRGMTVSTYSTAAGCGTLSLDQDCSQMSGSTRKIEIQGIPLRVSGSEDGKTIFVMSMPSFMPDEEALSNGTQALDDWFKEQEINITTTKVMYGSGKVFGVHYTLNKDGYSNLKALSVKKD